MKPFAIATVLMGALAVVASAQDYSDDPGPAVARLSLATGEVTVRRGDSGEFVAGVPNAPLVSRDHVLTGDNAQAEIQFDWANMLRLAPNSEVRLADLESGDFFLQFAEGTATFRVLRDSDTLVEISTPAVSIRPLDPGAYRLWVRPDGSTQLTVRSGSVEVYSARRTEVLTSGRTMEVSGDPSDPTLVVLNGIPLDDWDQWNESRDRDLDRSDSYRYVSRDIYGADDLAGHGRWVYDSPYGWVWVPHVSANWAPYRSGRWCWVDYYGWTWVSSDPWGWAPYHYGRWYYASSYGWVWYPGAPRVRHYWRPALVAFFGWNSGSVRLNVNLTFGFRNVAWVPLAPYEVYRPWYGRRPQTQVTINTITLVNVNTYRNARLIRGRNAITSVPTREFGRRQVNANNFLHVTDRELRRAGREGALRLEPTRESRQYSDRTAPVRELPQSAVVAERLDRRSRIQESTATLSGPEKRSQRIVPDRRTISVGSRSTAPRRETHPEASVGARQPAGTASRAGSRSQALPSREAPPRRVTSERRTPASRTTPGTNAGAREPSRASSGVSRTPGESRGRGAVGPTTARQSQTPARTVNSRRPPELPSSSSRAPGETTGTRPTQPAVDGQSSQNVPAASRGRAEAWGTPEARPLPRARVRSESQRSASPAPPNRSTNNPRAVRGSRSGETHASSRPARAQAPAGNSESRGSSLGSAEGGKEQSRAATPAKRERPNGRGRR